MRKTLVLSVAAVLAVAIVFASQSVAEEKAGKTAKVGQPAPAFALEDQNGKIHSLSDYAGKVVVLEWFNADCPYVVRHHKNDLNTMRDLEKKYADKGVVWLAVNSGHDTANEKNRETAEKWEIGYPILNDASGETGKAYGAKTTPHMYIIDQDGKLVYAGGIDDDRDNNKSKGEKTNYVDRALSEVLAGETVSQAETRPYGCTVKYGR
jgi:peroxiredoxin